MEWDHRIAGRAQLCRSESGDALAVGRVARQCPAFCGLAAAEHLCACDKTHRSIANILLIRSSPGLLVDPPPQTRMAPGLGPGRPRSAVAHSP